ncbi:MBL fold metallo-hydrolase [Chitinophagaceae bacterium MMS25-I14]
MQLTISGYSTALFSTWYFIDELGLLFDAGDGITSALMQKSRKINHVFISHADRDHLTGLLQLNQLNAREGFPVIHYPKDSSSFPALRDFSARFDPHVAGTVWTPVAEGEEIRIKDDILIIPLKNGHVPVAEGKARSFSYKVMQTRKKLKPEFAHLSGEEIRKISLEKGRDFISMELRDNILSYSGDTPVEDLHRWEDTRILIHEATFLQFHEDTKGGRENRHSLLEEVMEMVSGSNIEQLILGHFSSRYNAQQIDESIKRQCEKYGINIPVFRVLPGETVYDILKQQPVNK